MMWEFLLKTAGIETRENLVGNERDEKHLEEGAASPVDCVKPFLLRVPVHAQPGKQKWCVEPAGRHLQVTFRSPPTTR